MNSLWKKEIQMPEFPSLDGDCKTDVLIIGGGMAGLLCAHRLQQAGVDYRLVEADRICSGVTGNTTAKLTLQHGLIYGDLLRRHGLERAQMYWEANRTALNEYRQLSGRIDCDYEEKSNYVYVTQGLKKVEREMAALEKLGQSAAFIRHLPLPVSVIGAVKIRHQAQFHPLKFAGALVKDLHIHEQTKVQELTPDGALTNRGRIGAKTIIVTTHFPLLNKHGDSISTVPMCLPCRERRISTACMLTNHRPGCPFAIMGDICYWAVADTARERRVVNGGN